MRRAQTTTSFYRFVISASMAAYLAGTAVAAETTVDYALQVKPVLAEHCTVCHGQQKQENDLRLDTAVTALKGGISGPAIIPGSSADSLLVKAVHGIDDTTQMPPEGEALTADQISILTRWIDQGAKAPAEKVITEARSDHWAFQPPQRRALPSVEGTTWPRNAIDTMILSDLEQRDLHPSPEAPRETLIRRVHLDLLGIPPTVDEVDRFLQDTRPGAYGRLVDRVLASPRYGERWGRHWLDLARYADSNGYTRDFGREMWRYRDWLIDAINRDLPFDEFTVEQLAGDMLPDATLDQIIATGFHRNTLINEEGGTDPEQFRVDAVADRIETTGAAFLGLTLGCARCHDHKFDPISQREYYQLFALLNNCDEPTIDAPLPRQIELGLLSKRTSILDQIHKLEDEIAKDQDVLVREQLEWEKTITPEDVLRLRGPLQEAIRTPPAKRDEAAQKAVLDYFSRSNKAQKRFPRLERLAQLRESVPKIPTAMVMRRRSEPRETYIHRRGNFLDPLTRVDPQVPRVLPSLPAEVDEPTRLDFARWLVSADNPLTPRVIVNRHWQHFFGTGIVKTENDFGVQGSPPTQPELLDWLALEFVNRRWSVKSIHRLIVMSATYRQSSHWTTEVLARDVTNSRWARQSRLRLEAEIIRDSALAVSGLMTHRIGGPSVFPPQPDGVFEFTQDPKPWTTETGADRFRRGMYTHLWRSSPYPALSTFDFPEANTTCTCRIRSNTPLQSLVLANDVTFLECARAVASQVLSHIVSCDDRERGHYAFRLCLARRPTAEEVDRIRSIAQQYRSIYARDPESANELMGELCVSADDEERVELATWTATSRVLMNLDEFITRE